MSDLASTLPMDKDVVSDNNNDLKNLVAQFFTKCVSIIFDQRIASAARVPIQNQNPDGIPNPQIDDFWFDLHTNLATISPDSRNFLHKHWQSFASSSVITPSSPSELPPPLIIEVFLNLRDLQHGQKLYLEDKDSHPWLVVKGPRKTEVVLERWLVELTPFSSSNSTGSTDSNNDDNNIIYGRMSLMLKSLKDITELLPTYQLCVNMKAATNHETSKKFQNLAVQVRILDGRNKISTKGRIGLTKHLIGIYDNMSNEIDSVEINTERKIFEPLPTRFGMLRISLQFRKDSRFYVVSSWTNNDQNKTTKEIPHSSVELAALLKSLRASPSPPPPPSGHSLTPPQQATSSYHKKSPSLLQKQPQVQTKHHYKSSFSSNNAHPVPKYSSSFGSTSSTATAAAATSHRAGSFNFNNPLNSPLLILRSNSTVNSIHGQSPPSHVIQPPIISHNQYQQGYTIPFARRSSLDEELHNMNNAATTSKSNRLNPAIANTEDRDDIQQFLHSISNLQLSSTSSPSNVSRSSSISSSFNNRQSRLSSNNKVLRMKVATISDTFDDSANDDGLPSRFMDASTTLNNLTTSLLNFLQDLAFTSNSGIQNNIRRSRLLKHNVAAPGNFLLSASGASGGIVSNHSPDNAGVGIGIRYSTNSTSVSPRRFLGGTNFSNSPGTSPVFVGAGAAGTTSGQDITIPLSSSPYSNNNNNYVSGYIGQSVPSSFTGGGMRRSRYISAAQPQNIQTSPGYLTQPQGSSNNFNNSASESSVDFGRPASLGMLVHGNSSNAYIGNHFPEDSMVVGSVPTSNIMSNIRNKRTHRGSNSSNYSNYSITSSVVSRPTRNGISLPGLMSSASPSAIITTTNAYGKMNIDEGKTPHSSLEEFRRSAINVSNTEITIEEDSELKGGTSSGEQHAMSNSDAS